MKSCEKICWCIDSLKQSYLSNHKTSSKLFPIITTYVLCYFFSEVDVETKIVRLPKVCQSPYVLPSVSGIPVSISSGGVSPVRFSLLVYPPKLLILGLNRLFPAKFLAAFIAKCPNPEN